LPIVVNPLVRTQQELAALLEAGRELITASTWSSAHRLPPQP
jgi:hypothetical protein